MRLTLQNHCLSVRLSDQCRRGCTRQADTLKLSWGPFQCCPGLRWRGQGCACLQAAPHPDKVRARGALPNHITSSFPEDFSGQHRLADVASR